MGAEVRKCSGKTYPSPEQAVFFFAIAFLFTLSVQRATLHLLFRKEGNFCVPISLPSPLGERASERANEVGLRSVGRVERKEGSSGATFGTRQKKLSLRAGRREGGRAGLVPGRKDTEEREGRKDEDPLCLVRPPTMMGIARPFSMSHSFRRRSNGFRLDPPKMM